MKIKMNDSRNKICKLLITSLLTMSLSAMCLLSGCSAKGNSESDTLTKDTTNMTSSDLSSAATESSESETSVSDNTADSTAEVLEADVDGIQMKYAKIGNGEKTMIMLPGLAIGHVTDSADSVAEEYEIFADDFTIYLFDIEENVPEGYTVEQLASDTYTIIKSLGLSDFYLFGASLGGIMSICIDADHSDDVEKMMLASTTCKSNDNFDEKIENWIEVAETGDGGALEEDMGKTIYSEATFRANAKTLYFDGLELTSYTFKQFINTASTLVNFDVVKEAKKIKTDTCFVWSRGDQVITHDAFMDLTQYIDTGDIHIYNASYGHAVYDEAPDFEARMLDFFLAS